MKHRLGALALLFGMIMAASFTQTAPARADNAAPTSGVVAGNQVDDASKVQEARAERATVEKALRGCSATPKGDLVIARSQPRTSASRNGIIYRGQSADADCDAVTGGSYSGCPGGSGSWWVRVTWPAGVTSYVAGECVDWYRD